MQSTRIQKIFKNARVNGILPADPATGERGISFDIEDGTTIFLCLTAEDGEVLHRYLKPGYYVGKPWRDQSLMSSEIPNSEKSDTLKAESQ